MTSLNILTLRLVFYCRNILSELRSKLSIEFCLVILLVRCRNRRIECGSNPSSDRVPTVDDQPYWPIYPCYSPKRPMVECLFEYTNDPISVDQSVPNGNSSEFYIYEKMIQEGHDPRLFRLSPDINGGGHRGPENSQYWAVGCLGMTSTCSEVVSLDLPYLFFKYYLQII